MEGVRASVVVGGAAYEVAGPAHKSSGQREYSASIHGIGKRGGLLLGAVGDRLDLVGKVLAAGRGAVEVVLCANKAG